MLVTLFSYLMLQALCECWINYRKSIFFLLNVSDWASSSTSGKSEIIAMAMTILEFLTHIDVT